MDAEFYYFFFWVKMMSFSLLIIYLLLFEVGRYFSISFSFFKQRLEPENTSTLDFGRIFSEPCMFALNILKRWVRTTQHHINIRSSEDFRIIYDVLSSYHFNILGTLLDIVRSRFSVSSPWFFFWYLQNNILKKN